MTRTKSSLTKKRRHKKIKKQAKGFLRTRRKSYRKAKEAVIKAQARSFVGRKQKKREFRRLWIIRINAGLKKHGLKYSRFIKKLKDKKIALNRKILAQLAAKEPKIFSEIVKKIKE